jgi:tetratricopeptide (TPR) repeat protein
MGIRIFALNAGDALRLDPRGLLLQTARPPSVPMRSRDRDDSLPAGHRGINPLLRDPSNEVRGSTRGGRDGFFPDSPVGRIGPILHGRPGRSSLPLGHQGVIPLSGSAPPQKVNNLSGISTRLVLILLLGMVGSVFASGQTGESEEQRRQREYHVLMSERQAAEQYHDELTEAWSLYSALNIPDATKAFAAVRAAEGAGERDLVQALYGLGLCYRFHMHRPKIEEARACFDEIALRFPQNSVAAWALMERGSLEDLETEAGQVAARSFFRRVLEEYPESLAIHETALRLAGTYLGRTLDPELIREGLTVLEDHIENHPDNPLVGTMHYRVGYFYFACLQDYEKALPHSVATSTLRMEDPYRWPEDYWHTAMNFMRLDRPEEALPWFEQILIDKPTSREALPAKQMIERINRYLEDQKVLRQDPTDTDSDDSGADPPQ